MGLRSWPALLRSLGARRRSSAYPFLAASPRLFSTSTLRPAQEAHKPVEQEYHVRPSARTLKLEGQAIVSDDPNQPRVNPVGIQLLSKSLHEQIFPRSANKTPDILAVETSLAHLEANDLLKSAPSQQSPIDFPLPPLMGHNIDEHFHNIGVHEAEPYLTMAERFAATPPRPLPPRFSHASGWTRYDPQTGEATPVPYPEESALTFDVEVLYKINPYPIMAAALSTTHWYTWLSPWLLGESSQQEHLVPLGPRDQERIIVGHNVGYDRIRIKEEYHLGGTKNRFLDTMSFHSASQGVSAPQRGIWKSHWKLINEYDKIRQEKLERLENEAESLRARIAAGEVDELVETLEDALGAQFDYAQGGMFPKLEFSTISYRRNLKDRLKEVEDDIVDLPLSPKQEKDRRYLGLEVFGERISSEPEYEEATDEEIASADKSFRVWEDLTATNSLEEVFKLHFHGENINKTTRNAFAAEDRAFILEDLQNLIHYCASDVHATHRVYSRTLPRYRRLCPSPASFAGMLAMGSAFLPVNKSWDKYVQSSEDKYLELDGSIREKLAALAEKAREQWVEPPEDFKIDTSDKEALATLACPAEVKGDPWLSQLDWTPKKARHFAWAGKESMVRATSGNGKSGGVLPKSMLELGNSKVIPNSIHLCYHNCPVVWSVEHGWIYKRDLSLPEAAELDPETGPVHFNDERDLFLNQQTKAVDRSSRITFHLLPNPAKSKKVTKCLGKAFLKKFGDRLTCQDEELLEVIKGQAKKEDDWPSLEERLSEMLKEKGLLSGVQLENSTPEPNVSDGLPSDGNPRSPPTVSLEPEPVAGRDYKTASESARQAKWWPKWYHELFMPNVARPWDQMNFTVRSSSATLLLQLSWRGRPLFKSRQYGWIYRMSRAEGDLEDENRSRRLFFEDGKDALETQEEEEAARLESGAKPPTASSLKKTNPDIALHQATLSGEWVFFQVPHPNGEGQNVGLVTSKPFIKFIEDDTLSSVYPLAKDAMMMNVACSYWISVRERVIEQLAIRQSCALPMGFPSSLDSKQLADHPSPPPESSLVVGEADNDQGYGVILPQVIVMGTITRRAIEKTWLTASNAKKNRVGSELKAMIQAPEGYSIVGADVDSEELWIASLLGDAQLGMHGASAIGWMTLEGTKSAGTDVHSKTASIVNITRDMAKVFNYSRIYGAGVKNATRLLLDGMKEPNPVQAESSAKLLYLSTKGARINKKSRDFHSFWFGGSESYLFNSIEQVARSKRPTTPALNCGVTAALREEFLTNKDDHMTSRINWVVQSSGVDYLHLLIVAVNRLCKTYDIDARYLISVHDEVRYLVKDHDRYRLALALQIANLWTRSLFAYKLGMEDLPQGCAFFSEVDVDRVLRKEVSMPCVTPSNPDAIPPGEALGVHDILSKTGSSLFSDGSPNDSLTLDHASLTPSIPNCPPRPYVNPHQLSPTSSSADLESSDDLQQWKRFFLQAQALKTEEDVLEAWEHYGQPIDPIKAYQQRTTKFAGKWTQGGGSGGGRSSTPPAMVRRT